MHPKTKLVFALSGLGKTTLCLVHPEVTFDTDVAFDAALSHAFPELDERARRIAWRALARSQPWTDAGSADFRRWATARRRFVSDILAVLEGPDPKLVLTNMTLVPWRYTRYYGVAVGHYEAHWRLLRRTADNDQTEARNNRLEGFHPVTRLRPGAFLATDPHIIKWIDELKANRSA